MTLGVASYPQIDVPMTETFSLPVVPVDPQAFLAELINVHSPSMFRVAVSIVHDPSLAEDVVQESIIKAWQAADSFRGDASLRSWVLRITHNTAISTLRKRREDVRDPMMLPEFGDRNDRSSPDRQVAGRLMVDELWTALDTLDPVSRSIVILREVEGMAYEDISATLDLPLPTIKTRLFRARKALAHLLSEWK
jgi:RNA polymerase sigma-70 factor, ECF subfamily